MSINFKVVFGAAGAVVSGIAGFFVGKHFGRNKGYEEAMERYYDVNEDEEDEEDDEDDDDEIEEVEDDISDFDPRAYTVKIAEEEKMEPIDFNEVEIVEETIESYKKDSKKKKRPYMIDADIAGTDGFELNTIHFHKKSNTVTNEDDTEELVNVKNIIGFDVLNDLDSYEESLTLYVRNEGLGADFEVISIDDDWDGGSD